MILLLDTSTDICHIRIISNASDTSYEWEAGRQLSDGLLSFLEEKMQINGFILKDIEGIGVMKGPGSFTGLRIGAAVCNTIANTLDIPIVGENGEEWEDKALSRIRRGESDQIILPEYGRSANITAQRK